MGCCSPFNSVTGSASVDLSRHVNFTNGMVLGADDYTQEFAYHAARDRWIGREALGSGTLCGLAVEVEADGDNGPRIRVSPGSAIAPSGQLIGVGREQCGSLNTWLADKEIAAQVTAMAAGLSPPTAIDLTLHLTLCYTDCAVAPVPVPGEPCRSAEELMRPSRIADDYILNFSFTPPPLAEVEALALLDGFIAGLSTDAAGGSDATTLARLVARSRLQLSLAFGASLPVTTPADLAPIGVNPALRQALLLAIRRLWVTRLRPLVTAQPFGTAGDAANDCVLLAVLNVPVVNGGGGWEVRASAAAAAFSAAMPPRALAFLTASGPSPFTQGLLLIFSSAALTVTLAAPAATNQGHLLELRNLGTGAAQLNASGAASRIGAAPTYALAPGGRVTLRSNGAGTWQIVAQTAGRA